MQKHYSLKKRFLCLSLLVGFAFMALLTISCLLSLWRQLELTNLGYQREIDWLSEKLIQETTDTAYQLIKLSSSNESLVVLATNPKDQRIDYHRVTVGTLFKNLLAEMNYISGLFLVCPDTNTILVHHPTVLPSEKEKLETAVPLILKQGWEQLSLGRWNIIQDESGPLLLYVIRVYDAFLGAILTANSFDKLFASTDVDERIESRALLSDVPVWLYRDLYNESDHYYRIISALPVSGKLQLQLEWLIPASLYRSQLLRTAWPILLVALIAAVLIPTLIYYVYAIMLKPLKQMTAVMECIRSSDTLAKMDLGRSADEYQNIARTFNNMIDRIFNLQDTLSQKEIEKRDIQLSYLKLQINPHFYMNSLSIINNLAVLKDTELIEKMASCLTTYFRYTFDSNLDFATIQEELACIHDYLIIQQIRYPNHFQSRIQCQETCKSCIIPPLCIHSFVENSIKYAGNNTCMLMIVIDIRSISSERLRIEVQDNGQGYSLEDLKAINSGREIERDGRRHIGIWNVKQRLELLFPSARLWVENAPEGGAVSMMEIPMERRHSDDRSNG